MSTQLKQDIKQAINKALPAEVSKSIQDRLAEADRLEAENQNLGEQNKLLTKRLLEVEAAISSNFDLEKREQALDELGMVLNKGQVELGHQRKLDEVRFSSLKDRQADTWRMLELLLANRTTRERIQRKIPVDGPADVVADYVNGGNDTKAIPVGQTLEDATEYVERTEE